MSMNTMSARSAINYQFIKKSEFKKESELNFTEKQLITYDFYVLREKRTDKALNISATIDGLKWTENKTRRSMYYNDAIFKIINGKISLVGDFKVSNQNYVEKFYPRKFKNPFLNMCENTWINKAIRQLEYGA